jgi:hypothetical protein
VIRLQRPGSPVPGGEDGQAEVGADESHKSTPEPPHLS